MNVVAWVLGMVIAAVFSLTGVAKLLDLDRARDRFGYSKRRYRLVGLCEIAAAAGVVVGLLSTTWEWVAHAAAVGLCMLLLSALMAHARVQDDGKKVLPAAVMFVVSIVFIVALAVR